MERICTGCLENLQAAYIQTLAAEFFLRKFQAVIDEEREGWSLRTDEELSEVLDQCEAGHKLHVAKAEDLLSEFRACRCIPVGTSYEDLAMLTRLFYSPPPRAVLPPGDTGAARVTDSEGGVVHLGELPPGFLPPVSDVPSGP